MAEKSKLWYLANFNLFEDLSKAKMESLSSVTFMHNFAKNQPIYFAEEPSNSIFFLKKGRVKLTRMSPDGKEMIVALVNPGEVFGEMAIVEDGNRTDTAYALDETMICAISKDDFHGFVEENPELNPKVTKLIGLKLRQFSEKVEDLVFRDAPTRVVSFLLTLAEGQGKKIGDEIFVKPFLTHQDIAELTACTRQTVNTILTDLRENGIIHFDRKKLIIKNEKKLREMLK